MSSDLPKSEFVPKEFCLNTCSLEALPIFYPCSFSLYGNSLCISVWYGNSSNQDCKALQRVVRLAERISGSALPSLQDIYLKRCKSRAAKILKDSNHPGNHLFSLLPSGKHFRSMMAKTEELLPSGSLTQTQSHKHLQDSLLTVKHSYSHHPYCCCVHTRYNPVCTSLLFILLFI